MGKSNKNRANNVNEYKMSKARLNSLIQKYVFNYLYKILSILDFLVVGAGIYSLTTSKWSFKKFLKYLLIIVYQYII